MKLSGRIVDIFQDKIYPGEITISEGKIISIKKCKSAESRFFLPGFIDAHVHIESSMLTPAAFASAAVKHGTIGAVSDPHEIANVLGMDGVEYMINNSRLVPFYFWFGAPSCVPASDFETSGAKIGADQTAMLLKRPEIKYLSEMMNFPGVINGDKEVLKKIEFAKRLGKPIDGHAPQLSGENLRKYVDAGISTDHECSSIEEALEKISLGMNILIREGSAAKNLEALKGLFKTQAEKIMLCSDDIHPEMLEKRHINKIVAKLINDGYDLFNVLRSCSLNVVRHYDLEAGLLREGDSADFILVNDLADMNISETWIKGNKVFENGRTLFSYHKSEEPNRFNSSRIKASDLKIARSNKHMKVIKASDGELLTSTMLVESGSGELVLSDTRNDILKIVVKERYNDSPPSVGFINGFSLKKGAFGSSIAHDSHNIICVGTDDASISECINEIIRLKGGMSVVSDKGIKSLQLKIGGIMSDDPLSSLAARYQELSDEVKDLGCVFSSPFMTLSFMALLVIPELKISDRGLFDGKKFTFTSLFVD